LELETGKSELNENESRYNYRRKKQESERFILGNNAAWLCDKCSKLVGARTSSDSEILIVRCECGQAYELVADPNRSGAFNTGPVKAVRLVN
jgi:hypothetical protein